MPDIKIRQIESIDAAIRWLERNQISVDFNADQYYIHKFVTDTEDIDAIGPDLAEVTRNFRVAYIRWLNETQEIYRAKLDNALYDGESTDA